MYIVLVMKGKGACSSADSGHVKVFEDMYQAEEYAKQVTTDGKYWTYAEVVTEGEEIEFFPQFSE